MTFLHPFPNSALVSRILHQLVCTALLQLVCAAGDNELNIKQLELDISPFMVGV